MCLYHGARFVMVSNLCIPLDDGRENRIFISRSYDASSHFETVCHDVVDMYQRIMGKELILQKRPTQEEEQQQQAAASYPISQ